MIATTKKNTWIMSLLGSAGALTLINRNGKHSGATWAEYQQPLPGDEVIADPELEITNASTIFAPADKIWPWLV